MRRALLGLLVVLACVPVGAYAWISTPTGSRGELPPGLIALDSAEGSVMRKRSGSADLEPLLRAFQVQEKRSWCGVASQAIVLSLLRGAPVAQADVLTPGAWSSVTFGGMTLAELSAMLAENGAHVDTAGDFRTVATENLRRPGDYVLVNYSRATLGQGDGGHISPLGAYDAVTDRFLVLDVAAYKWPPVWVDADDLVAAMGTIDPSSGRSRGFVVVSGR